MSQENKTAMPVNTPDLPNIPWEERPTGSDAVMWRSARKGWWARG